MRPWLLVAVLVGGCDFGRVVVRNARWFFRTPAPAPRADRPQPGRAPLAVTWVGHATVVIELGRRLVVTDPVLTETVGGFSRRLVQPGLEQGALPWADLVLISHRHFDHLSKDSLRLLAPRSGVIITPRGAAADVPVGPAPVVELPWWRTFQVGEGADRLEVTAVPVAHEGTRLLVDADEHPEAFGGYVVEAGGRVVFFPGDTAFDEAVFDAVAARFPAIDVALLPIGPLRPEGMMRPHHLDPEQAVAAFERLGARVLVPIHYGTFLHGFDEPGECEARFDAAARHLGSRAVRLVQGQRLELEAVPAGR